VKHLIPHYIQDQFLSNRQTGVFRAFTMFVDLSGFTPLMDVMAREGSRGAEQMSVILNDIFAPLVRLVYTKGGFIPYFAGDAFIAVFPEGAPDVNAREALFAALQARNMFSQRAFRFGEFTIGIKIGLAYGDVEWGIVGDQHKSFYFRGNGIDQCTACQIRAQNQDIVLDAFWREQAGPYIVPLEEIDESYYRVVGNIPFEETPLRPSNLPMLDESVGLRFLPAPLLEHKGEGEFRTVIAVFLSFTGLKSHDALNEFATIILNQVNNFSGYFKEVDFSDKGGVIVVFFGAPISFENNTDRAIEFLLAIWEELRYLKHGAGVEFRAGVTLGTAYTGIVGGEERCQYAAVGHRINLAARIMTYADWGDVLVDGEIHKNRHFRFQHKGDIKYKGIKGNIPTFKLIGRDYDNMPAYTGTMVGRQAELEQLFDFSKPLLDNRPAGIAYVYGEAGIGKSRVAYELRLLLAEHGLTEWHQCQSDQILRKPFNPFVYFLKNYFDQSPDRPLTANREYFESRGQALLTSLEELEGAEAAFVSRELQRTHSVLAALIGISYPDSLWEQLDAKGRYQNSISAIINLIAAEALLRPLVLELEDGHWIDDSSRELLHELARGMNRHRLLLLITSRYLDDGAKPVILAEDFIKNLGVAQLEINLNVLQPESVRAFAEARLGGPISEPFFDLLLRATNSNPFYLEQVLEYFSESQVLEYVKGFWTIKDKNIKLSDSINSILTARIDRLSALVRETVKAAAVIGREFELPVLTEVMKVQEEFVLRNGNSQLLLKEQVKTAEESQIWQAMNELRYIFRHSLLREAAYSMQLRVRLQQLHQLIAEAIERLYADNIEERYVDLAFHYEQAGVFDKTCLYLRKAADYSKRNYQNQQALEYYEKLLKKLGRQSDVVDQIRTYIKKGKIQELIGQWEACEQTYEKALGLAKKSRDVVMLGQANNNLGHLLMLRGDYAKAMNYLQIAAGLFESIEDELGLARVQGNLGNLYFRQGKYDEAMTYFERSIELGYTRTGTAGSAQIVANLGLTYMNQGKYDEGIRCQEVQLDICRRQNDKQGMATLFTNMGIVYFERGDYDDALSCYEQGLALSEELGNKQLTSIAIGCIGSVYERKGNYEKAMELFRQDLALCEELGDKQGIAIALGLIGELYSVKGDFYLAIDYLQKNLMLCEELSYQKGIAKAVNTLGDVFYYTREFRRSLQHYNRAIDITRKINNRLVLGSSLVEKGMVLLEIGDMIQLDETLKDAMAIAHGLGNPDLLFEAELLNARTHTLHGRKTEARKLLHHMLDLYTDPDKLAAIYYVLFRLEPENPAYKEEAIARYEALYKTTPKYVFSRRLGIMRDWGKG